jgi:hypothetical protein
MSYQDGSNCFSLRKQLDTTKPAIFHSPYPNRYIDALAARTGRYVAYDCTKDSLDDIIMIAEASYTASGKFVDRFTHGNLKGEWYENGP